MSEATTITRQRRTPTPAPAGSLLLTPTQAAAELGFGRTVVYELIQKKMLPAVRISGSLRIRRSDLELYILRLPQAEVKPFKSRKAKTEEEA